MSLDTETEGSVFMELRSLDDYFAYGCDLTGDPLWTVKCWQNEPGIDKNVFEVKYARADWHIFRFTIEPTVNRIKFYLDGKLKHTLVLGHPNTFSASSLSERQVK